MFCAGFGAARCGRVCVDKVAVFSVHKRSIIDFIVLVTFVCIRSEISSVYYTFVHKTEVA